MESLNDYFFAPLGILVFIGFVVYQLLDRENQLDNGLRVGNELLDRYPILQEEFTKFESQHPHWSRRKLIKEFFTDERMEEVLKWERDREELHRKVQERLNKEGTPK